MEPDLNDIMIPLGMLALVVSYIILYRRMWCGPSGLMERAMEAADEGDEKKLLRLADRLVAHWRRDPERWYRPEEFAALLVCWACEWEQQAVAEALLRHLKLSRAELVWVEEGKEGKVALPLLEYLQREPEENAAAIDFLTQEEEPRS